MGKLLLACGNCEIGGKRVILGELKEGALWIMRFHSNLFTIIKGDFQVFCSNCGEPTYVKESNSFREQRVLGTALIQQTTIIGTPSLTG